MPQMAPIYWLYLFIYFLICMILFLTINYFLKPFDKISPYYFPFYLKQNPWKL